MRNIAKKFVMLAFFIDSEDIVWYNVLSIIVIWSAVPVASATGAVLKQQCWLMDDL